MSIVYVLVWEEGIRTIPEPHTHKNTSIKSGGGENLSVGENMDSEKEKWS
jgi:hypothetical protein